MYLLLAMISLAPLCYAVILDFDSPDFWTIRNNFAQAAMKYDAHVKDSTVGRNHRRFDEDWVFSFDDVTGLPRRALFLQFLSSDRLCQKLYGHLTIEGFALMDYIGSQCDYRAKGKEGDRWFYHCTCVLKSMPESGQYSNTEEMIAAWLRVEKLVKENEALRPATNEHWKAYCPRHHRAESLSDGI